jgi:hypothetical protein
MVALLGGLGSVAAAQDEEGRDRDASYVTGRATDVRTISDGWFKSVAGIQVFDVKLEYDIDWATHGCPR